MKCEYVKEIGKTWGGMNFDTSCPNDATEVVVVNIGTYPYIMQTTHNVCSTHAEVYRRKYDVAKSQKS